MSRINNLFEKLAHVKVYFASAGVYTNIVNFALILATFKATYNIDIPVYVLVPFGFVCIITVGFIDYTMILKHQQKHVNKQNDLKVDMIKLEKKIDKLLSKNE